MTKISILFVIDGLEFGGGERVFLQLAAGLKDRYQVFVASMPGGKFEKELNKFKIPFFTIDVAHKVSLKPIYQIKSIIKAKKIEIVHSQGARADFFARIACRLAGNAHLLCTVAMPVDGFDIGPFKKNIYRLMDRFTERYVKRFIVVSDSLKDFLTTIHKIPTEKVIKIYNGIELDQYHPEAINGNLRRELGICNDIPLVGAIGRMVWQKGFKYLVRSVPAILNRYPEAKIVFIGDGPQKNVLQRLATSLQLRDNVVFTGFRNDIQQILSSLDLLVVPSVLEGFPMITLEGMAMAKPIIASSLPGILEQIENGKTGIVVPPKNPAALGNGIIDLLLHKDEAQRLGRNARKIVVEKFSVEKMLFKTDQAYQRLFSGKNCP
jgi:glycosyltransferase involved in cell wall biosynthesis